MHMNPAGYSRFNDLVEAIAALDTAVLVDSFHTMRPLYEQAYGLLGLNPNEFDNAVIRMLDWILATPEIEGPIALTRKSVLYQFADPQLEGLVPLQKTVAEDGAGKYPADQAAGAGAAGGAVESVVQKRHRGLTAVLSRPGPC